MSEAIDITSIGRSHGRLTGPIFLRAVDQLHLLGFRSARSKDWPVNHRRSADLARTGDVLCSVFHSPGEPEGFHRRNHGSSGGGLDASDSLQRDIGGYGRSERLSLRFARSRCQVLRSVPRQVSTTSFAQSKLERFCGTQRAIGQRGVPLPADPVRESFVEESNH